VTIPPPDLAGREMDARLERGAERPLAVALSGGGDSLALLLMARAWARQANRRLIAFTVDHGLHADSHEWSLWCAGRASRLGVAHRTLTWTGEKPRTGVAAAARAARHRLIADAARAAGARVTLFGHTADDVLEAEAMRADGLAVASPHAWSPSPVWPEGRELFILRPLLGARRSELRDWLTDWGEAWIDDPANADPHQPRVRVRALVAALPTQRRAQCAPMDLSAVLAAVRFGPAGDLSVALEALNGAPALGRRRFLGAAITSVAGAQRIARGPFFFRLPEAMERGEVFASTVGGALTSSDGERLTIVREIGDRRSRASPTVVLPTQESLIWDGRFEVRARAPGLSLAPLWGRAARLDKAVRPRLAALTPSVRRAVPAVINSSGAVTCPTLTSDPRVEIRGLIAGRLAGACGKVQNESQIGETADAHVL
jgi:tRNA(Ile)-lysidine synthase